MGGQIAWLIPAALIFLVAGVAAGRPDRPYRPPARRVPAVGRLAAWSPALVFSFMQGIFHAYYTVALAPAIGALIGMGAWLLWRHRSNVVLSGVLRREPSPSRPSGRYVLLGRSADFHPWLRSAVLVVGLLAAAAIMAVATLPRPAGHAGSRPAVAAGLALFAGLAGPAAYAPRPRPPRTRARSSRPARR